MENEILNENKSYQSIFLSAKQLFWKHGISRVTVEEICMVAGVSKMTFYRNFSNKKEIAKIVLNEICKSGFEDYKNIMASDLVFPEKIQKLVLLKHNSVSELSEEFVYDIYNKEETELQEILIEYQKQMIGNIIADFTEAQNNGWIRKDVKISFLVFYLNKINEMIVDQNFRKLYPNIHDAVMELTNLFFYGIINQNSELNVKFI